MINGQSLRQLKKYEIIVASKFTANRKEEIKYTLWENLKHSRW